MSGYGGKSSLAVNAPLPDLTYEADVLGLTATYELDNLTVRFGHVDADAKIAGETRTYKTTASNLARASTFGCTTCTEIGQKFDRLTTGFDFSVTNIGLRYSQEAWTTWGEYVRSRNNTLLQPSQAFLLGVSYNIGEWTPYLAYGSYQTKGNDQAVITNAPVPFAALATGVNAILDNQATSRNTLALGVRYDIRKNLALKTEVMHVRFDKASANPNSFPVIPAVRPGVVIDRPQNFNLFTLALDFVF